MAALYSTRFASISSLNGVRSLGVVPAGFIWIVRDIAFFLEAIGGPYGTFISDGTGGIVFYQAISSSAPYAHWEGRQVFPAGDELFATTNAASAVMVSGYVLTAP